MISFCLTGCVFHRVSVRVARRAILLALVVMLGCGLCAQEPAWVEAARGVIARFAGAEVAQSLTLQACEAEAGRPICEVSENGRCLRGSSAVALCKGFYANTLRKGAGICSWSGSRFDAERAFAPGPDFVVRSPYRHVQYLNVVTSGLRASNEEAKHILFNERIQGAITKMDQGAYELMRQYFTNEVFKNALKQYVFQECQARVTAASRSPAQPSGWSALEDSGSVGLALAAEDSALGKNA